MSDDVITGGMTERDWMLRLLGDLFHGFYFDSFIELTCTLHLFRLLTGHAACPHARWPWCSERAQIHMLTVWGLHDRPAARAVTSGAGDERPVNYRSR